MGVIGIVGRLFFLGMGPRDVRGVMFHVEL